MKAYKPAPVVAHHEPVARPHHPVGYSVADHLARIFRSSEYAEAAKSVGHTVESFQDEVATALKKIIGEQHAQELHEYEAAHGPRAVAAAVEKAKAAKAA